MPFQNALETQFRRRFNPKQFEMFRRAKRVDLGRVSYRVDDIVFVVFDFCEDAFGKNVRAVPLPQFVPDRDEQLARRVQTARADLVPDHVGKGIVIKTLLLQVSGDLALTGSVSASKSY